VYGGLFCSTDGSFGPAGFGRVSIQGDFCFKCFKAAPIGPGVTNRLSRIKTHNAPVLIANYVLFMRGCAAFG